MALAGGGLKFALLLTGLREATPWQVEEIDPLRWYGWRAEERVEGGALTRGVPPCSLGLGLD